jgi:hypothetical protein
MFNLGMTLIVLGIGSFLLPLAGIQFRILSIFGDSASGVGVVLAIVGFLLLIPSMSKSKGQSSSSPSQEALFQQDLEKLKPYMEELMDGFNKAETEEELEALYVIIANKAEVSTDAVKLLLIRLVEYFKTQQEQTSTMEKV